MDDRDIVSSIIHRTHLSGPRTMPGGLWWDELDDDFYKRPETFELDRWDRLRVNLTSYVDIIVRIMGGSVAGTLALPVGYHPFKLRESERDYKIYISKAESKDPKQFFVEPPAGVKVSRKAPCWPYFKPDDGIVEDLSFESPFEPVNRRIKLYYTQNEENMTARARYWRHKGGSGATICLIHGFFVDHYRVNEWYFSLRELYSMGADILLYTLPFHGPRKGRRSIFSGYGLFAGGLTQLNEAMAHAVYDFRIFFNFLQDEAGAAGIGVTGISLGGYITALLACVEERLKFAIPNVPVVSFPDLLLEWFPLSTAVRAILFTRGNTLADLRHIMAVHSPLTYRPVLPKDRLMIIGGAGDRLAPPKHSRLLWDHWDRCRIYWFPGSHFFHLDRGNYLVEIEKFLDDIDFLGHKR